MKILRLALATILACSLAATSVLEPRAASAANDEVDNILIAHSYTFGGVVGGLSYSDLWGRKVPQTLYVSDDVTTMSASVFFANSPRFGPDGFPVTGAAEVRYRWEAWGCASGGYTRALTDWRIVNVPVHPNTHVIGTPLPSAVDAVELPSSGFTDCTMLSTRLEAVAPQNGVGTNVGYINISSTPPPGMPAFDPATEPDGRIALYTLASNYELDQVQMNGALSEIPAGAFRYFFTSCAAARNVLGALTNPGGIVRIRTSAQGIAENALGVIAKKSGASDVQAWGLQSAMGVADAEADRVTGDEPFCAT